MKIRRVHIENFRSIEKLDLDGLGDFVVFYGRNGVGKSNILRAISCGLGLLRGMSSEGLPPAIVSPPWLSDVFGPSDRRIGSSRVSIELVIDLEGEPTAAIERGPTLTALHVRCVVQDVGGGRLEVSLPVLTATAAGSDVPVDLAALQRREGGYSGHWPGMNSDDGNSVEEFKRATSAAIRVLLYETVGERCYAKGDDVRGFGVRRDDRALAGAKDMSLQQLLHAGRVEEAIARAGLSVDDRERDQFDYFCSIMARPPLALPNIEPVVDAGGQYRLRQSAHSDGRKRATVASTATSLGWQQLLIILGGIVFGRSRIYGLEEPEAHLHAPTSGRALRQLLRELVADGQIDQLLIATHSNLFDLDPGGFWSVQLVSGTTSAVYETELSRIDQDHLFEPGPAKRVLQDLLRHGDASQIVATGPDGAEISAAQMLNELQSDSEVGVRYAAELSRAAARMFLRARPKLVGSD